MTTLLDRPLAPEAPVPARRRNLGRLLLLGAAVTALVVGHVIALNDTDVSLVALAQGWEGMARFVGEAFPPDLSWDEVVSPGIDAAVLTFWIGLLGTTLSIPSALVLAVLGARPTNSSRAFYQAARTVMSLLRAVPDVVFALIFVTAVGLGPFAGVLALICHNTGVMGKLWSEAIEEMPPGPVQALRTTGARRAQVIGHGVLPAVIPSLTGLLLYRLDVNVRSSLVLGLVGAGGIGFLINRSIKLFAFDQMATYIGIVLVLVVAVDLLSGAVRRQLSR